MDARVDARVDARKVDDPNPVQGNPGVGKTTLAMQFLLEGVRAGESCLYVTLSESEEEIREVADAHGWDLANLHIYELSAAERLRADGSENTLYVPSEIELNEATSSLVDVVERVNPSRAVFDSLSELRLLKGGVMVGEPLVHFQGVLSGVPSVLGGGLPAEARAGA